MQDTGKESDINKPFKQIGSVGQLREELKLGEDIVIPEIEQAITFTREEWQKLKEDISGKEGFQIAEIIKAKLSKKIKLSTAAQESSVRARTEMRARALKENVDKGTDLPKIQSGQGREIPSVNNTQQQNTPEATKLTTQNSSSITEHPWEWAKENPISAVGTLAGTAIVGYTLYSLFSGDSDSKSHEGTKEGGSDKESFIDGMLDKFGITGDYAKWAKRLGVFGLVVAAGIGLFMGKEKIGEYWDKLTDMLGFESKEMKAAYESFAKTISASGDKVEVKPDIIKKIKGEKIKDFISIKGQITATIQNGFKQGLNFVLPDVVKKLGISADENELKQTEALQIYLDKEIKEGRLNVSDETTIEDLVKKLSGNPELIQEADKDPSHKIIIGGVLGDSNLPKDGEKGGEKKEEGPGASPYPVLAARTYQLYYGVFAPWNKMSLIEKNYVMSYWPKLGGRLGKDMDFISARQSLPALENEYRLLTEKVGSLTKDEAAGLVLLEQRIQSIKAGPKAFKDFTLLVAQGPEAFLGRVDKLGADIEASTGALNSRDSLRNGSIKKFKESYLQHEALLREQNLIAGKLVDEIKDIDKQIAVATSPNEITRLKGIKEGKIAQLGTIEDHVIKMTEKFVKYQEQVVPLLKDEKGVKLSFAGWVKQFKGQEINSIEHIKVSPEKQFFRLGMTGKGVAGALVLTGLGMGASAYFGKNPDGTYNKEQIIETGKRIGWGFCPVKGTMMDWNDAVKSFKSQDWLGGAANSAAFVASLAGDILLGISFAGTFGIGTPVGIAAKAGTGTIRGTIKSWAAGMEVAKAAKIARVTAVAGTCTALALGVGVPIASWALNSEGKAEQGDHTKIDPKGIEYLS